MGSDFTNNDIVMNRHVRLRTLIGSETVDGYACYKIQLDPKPEAAVVWGKIIYYAREGDCLPVREEFYNEHGVLKKYMACGAFKTMHDRVIPTVYKMQTTGKEDQYTIMELKETRLTHRYPGGVTLQNLTRK